MTEKTHATRKPVGVYEPSDPSWNQPSYYTPFDEALRLVRNGDADKINHGKHIRLRRASDASPLKREPSAGRGGASANPTVQAGRERPRWVA